MTETMEDLDKRLKAFANLEGGDFFMGWPDRWLDSPTWRCVNGHVSKWFLKSEGLGRDVCVACRQKIHITFPEDVEDS